jgi:cyclophilin family peptidyl-prolyl cis-trans isomerase
VSAIRALGSLKDASVAEKLIPLSMKMAANAAVIAACEAVNEAQSKSFTCNEFKNEYLEISTTLGRLLPNTNNQKAIDFLNRFNELDKYQSPEINIALAKIAPKTFVESVINSPDKFFSDNWRTHSATYQGLAEIANLESNKENDLIKSNVRLLMVQRLGDWVNLPAKVKINDKTAFAIPDLLSAFAAFKSQNTSNIVREMFTLEPDVQIRATIAGILADQPASMENVEALKKAFDVAFLNDKDSNDAQLAILSALFKLDKKEAIPTLLIAVNSKDYLVRKAAFQFLKDESYKDSDLVKITLEKFTTSKKNQVLPYSDGSQLGQVLNTNADYIRALSRKNGTVKAVFTTSKGNFTIDFTPEDAPLTVDNFIKLARSNYFNGVSVHRVVPNFVMQDGDPRGDGNGGPGWEIRCEINMLSYERGAVGMALSGKDTGGSQWFVTHSPQPHLDGGYTVFGKVNEADMKVVDSIVRGDKIISVKIVAAISTQKRKGAKTQKASKNKYNFY